MKNKEIRSNYKISEIAGSETKIKKAEGNFYSCNIIIKMEDYYFIAPGMHNPKGYQCDINFTDDEIILKTTPKNSKYILGKTLCISQYVRVL